MTRRQTCSVHICTAPWIACAYIPFCAHCNVHASMTALPDHILLQGQISDREVCSAYIHYMRERVCSHVSHHLCRCTFAHGFVCMHNCTPRKMVGRSLHIEEGSAGQAGICIQCCYNNDMLLLPTADTHGSCRTDTTWLHVSTDTTVFSAGSACQRAQGTAQGTVNG